MSGFEKLLQKFNAPEIGDAELPSPPPSKAGNLEAFIQKFSHVTEEYSFYNGTITLRFNVDEHCYYRIEDLGNLIKLDGVTNSVGIIDKSMMLTPWGCKMMAQKLLRIIPVETDAQGVMRIKPLTLEEFTVYVMEAKGAHKEKLEEAGDIGHLAHKCIEDSIRLAIKEDPDKKVRKLINLPADERAVNAANGAKSWMDLHNVRWVETESKVYSKEHEYAGTMDGLAYVDSCGDKACCPEEFKDRLSLADWKSSNSLKLEYLFQVSAYKYAKMEEHPNLNIVDIWILRLGKSEEEAGKFEPWHMTPDEYDEDFQGFLACLRLTRLVHSVEERMKGQKGRIRAVRKEQRETAKAIAKEQAKLAKALEKAAKKVAKEEEKLRIKAEAKAERERLKAEKKMGVTHRVEVDRTVNPALLESIAGSIPAAPTITKEESCTSSSKTTEVGSLVSSTPTVSSTSIESVTPETRQSSTPTTSTEATECTSTTNLNEDSTQLVSTPPTESGTPTPTGVAESKQSSKSTTLTEEAPITCATLPTKDEAPERWADNELQYEEEVATPVFNLPMEG